MRKQRGLGLFIGGMVAALVLSGGVAVAANGNPLLIGKDNTGTKTTKLSVRSGTPLALKGNGAPMRVSNSKKVYKLNADYLDGISASAFARVSGRTGFIATQGSFLDVTGDGLADGLVGSATCPAGTRLTGGGADNLTTNDTFLNSPDANTANTWETATLLSGLGDDVPTDLVTYAVCYSPTGAVPGATGLNFRGDLKKTTEVSKAAKDALARMVARAK